MAAKEKGAVIDVLEKRISDLERRVLTNEEDVLNLKGSSVIILFYFRGAIVPNLYDSSQNRSDRVWGIF